MRKLKLYSRSYCHLCHDMEVALQAQFDLTDVELEVLDIDATGQEAALAQWDELVPVLLAQQADGNWQELCHYFLAPQAVAAWLGQAPRLP